MTARVPRPEATLAVFSFTLFLSAACMFALQPMAGRMLLPLVGGTPAGWVVAMAFFQVMLLLGYLLAHLFSRFSPRAHAGLYIAALAAGMFFLPVNLAAHAGLIHDSPGPLDVFKILAATLTVPFIALSATSSTIQRLFMATGHKAAKDPYFLYAASNLGSFAGLLAYPLLIEPRLTLTAQTRGWMFAYVLLAAAAAACLLLSGKTREAKAAKPKKEKPLPNETRLMWLLLAFFPSSLLLGVTTYITTDMISMPLVWVIPLALYLLGFAAAFARRPPVPLKAAEILTPLAVIFAIVAISCRQMALGLGLGAMIVHLACFAVLALYCNLRLAALRPAGARLTEFYLILSLGGALGGLFNAFIAPNVFIRVMEYPLCLMAVPLLLPGNGPKSASGRLLLACLAGALLCANADSLLVPPGMVQGALILCGLLAAAAILVPGGRAGFMFPAFLGVFLVMTFLAPGTPSVAMKRNFFGALRVYEASSPGDPDSVARYLMHGTTLHGFQILEKNTQNIPVSYYTRSGPVGDIFARFQPARVAVVGLGTGTISCYKSPKRKFTFFDIDPDVVDIAKSQFTFLRACAPPSGPPRIVVGDGRLELAKLKNEKFDLIVLDAFSSDAIPAHLLTHEAFNLYFDRLAPRGVLALHISNRHFILFPPIAATADMQGLQFRVRATLDANAIEPYAVKSMWVILARKDTPLRDFTEQYGWADILRDPAVKPWTDDYINLPGALKLSL